MTKAVRAKKIRIDQEPRLRVEFKPKTKGQESYLRTIIENDIVFCTGPAGCGKSYLAIGLACQYLLESRYDYLVIARPTIEAAPRSLGALPGVLEDKLSPYLYPTIEHVKLFLGADTYKRYKENDMIRFEALEFCRGRTYNNSMIILDEAQNCNKSQLVMFVTRIGENSKMIICGDTEQSDMRLVGDDSDLQHVIDRVNAANLPKFGISHLDESSIIRNPLIAGFLRAMK